MLLELRHNVIGHGVALAFSQALQQAPDNLDGAAWSEGNSVTIRESYVVHHSR